MDYTTLLKEPLVEVKCGILQGILHMDCFYCPGIHCPCIQYNGQMISPKKFTILGEKQNLKDWKKAVRIYKSSMRDLMERGYLDFHNHEQTCTGKCMSRTPSKSSLEMMIKNEIKTFVVGKQGPFEKDLRFFNITPAAKAVQATPRGSSGFKSGPIITDVVGGQEHMSSLFSESEPKTSNGEKNITPDRLFLNTPSKPRVYMVGESAEASPVRIKEEPISPDTDVELGLPTSSVNPGFDELVQLADRQTSHKPSTDTMSDSVKFWEGIVSLGLLDEFIKEIKLSLDMIRSRFLQLNGDSEKDAIKLSNVVNDLGLFRVLQEKMREFQRQTQEQQLKLNMEISLLEKKWSLKQKWKSSLAKTQQLIEQVSVSSRMKRPLTALTDGDTTEDEGNLSSKTKSPKVNPKENDTASQVVSPFVITINNESMETDDFTESCLTESPIPQARNEDFLVTITSRHQKSSSNIQTDEEDRIYSERQKELEMDTEDKCMSQLELTPRRSHRTRTLSAKGLAYSETESLDDDQNAGFARSFASGSEISDKSPCTEQQVEKQVNSETVKSMSDKDKPLTNFPEVSESAGKMSNALNEESIDQYPVQINIKVEKKDTDQKETAPEGDEKPISS